MSDYWEFLMQPSEMTRLEARAIWVYISFLFLVWLWRKKP